LGEESSVGYTSYLVTIILVASEVARVSVRASTDVNVKGSSDFQTAAGCRPLAHRELEMP
jgi:hypothetical protein